MGSARLSADSLLTDGTDGWALRQGADPPNGLIGICLKCFARLAMYLVLSERLGNKAPFENPSKSRP